MPSPTFIWDYHQECEHCNLQPGPKKSYKSGSNIIVLNHNVNNESNVTSLSLSLSLSLFPVLKQSLVQPSSSSFYKSLVQPFFITMVSPALYFIPSKTLPSIFSLHLLKRSVLTSVINYYTSLQLFTRAITDLLYLMNDHTISLSSVR